VCDLVAMLGFLFACENPHAMEKAGMVRMMSCHGENDQRCACLSAQDEESQNQLAPDTIVVTEDKSEDCYSKAPADTMVSKEKPLVQSIGSIHYQDGRRTQQDVKKVRFETSEKEKEIKKGELKELLGAFVASAKEGLHCTALRVIDDDSLYKSSVVLSIDEQLKSVCLTSSKMDSWLHGLDSWKALLSECQIYGYDTLEEMRPDSESLKFVAPEDRQLCTMIFHNEEWMCILAKDADEQYAIMKSLQVLAVRANHIAQGKWPGPRARMGGA